MEIIRRVEAAKAGLTRFYTGKKCRHGHQSERFVSNGVCVKCGIAASTAYQKRLTTTMREARDRLAEVR